MKQQHQIAMLLLLACTMATPVIAQQVPSPPATLDAAMDQGLVITANRLAKDALRATQNKDLNVLYKAAEAAAQAGEQSLALTRYRAFVKQSTEKTPRMRDALVYLLERGVYLEGLTKYVDLVGAGGQAWEYGRDFFQSSFKEGTPELAVGTIELLVKHYGTDADKMYDLLNRVYNNRDNIGDDVSVEQRLGRAMTAIQPSDMGHFDRCLNEVWSRLDAQDRFDNAVALNKTLKRPLPSGIFKWFGEITRLPEEARVAAGRAFLALEPIYRDQGDAMDYRNFVVQILAAPQVFHIEGKELVNELQIQQRLDAVIAKIQTQSDAAAQLSDPFSRLRSYLPDAPARAAYFKKHVGLLTIDRFRELVELTEGKQLTEQVTQWVQGKPITDLPKLLYALLDWYNKINDKARLITATQGAMKALTGTWNPDHIANQFMGSALPSADEKVAVLNAVHAVEGSSATMRALVVATEKKDKAWAEHVGFKALKAAVAQDKPAADPVRKAYLAMLAIKQDQKNPNAAVYAAADAFLKAYTGKIPGAAQGAATTEEYLANRVLEQHLQHVVHSKTEIEKAALLWGPRVTSTGEDIEYLLRRATEWGHSESLLPAFKAYLALVKQGQPLNMDMAWRMVSVYPKGEAASPFDGMLDKLGNDSLEWLNRHMDARTHSNNRWPVEFYFEQIGKVLALPGVAFSKNHLHGCLDRVQTFTTPEVFLSEPVLMQLTDQLLAATPDALDHRSLNRLYDAFARSERYPAVRAWFDAVATKLQSRAPLERLNSMLAVVENIRDSENRAHILETVIKPAIDRIPAQDRHGIAMDRAVLYQFKRLAGEGDEAQKAARTKSCLQISELAVTQATLGGDRRYEMVNYLQDGLVSMIERGAWRDVLRALDRYAVIEAEVNPWSSQRFDAIVKAMEEQKAYEAIFAFATLMQSRVQYDREQAVKELIALKSRAARNIPGLLPVDKSDPTYALHLAAHQLSLGSETRAWELTQPKLALLREQWASMDLAYVAWAIDQMRKQNLYKEALEFSFLVLLKE